MTGESEQLGSLSAHAVACGLRHLPDAELPAYTSPRSEARLQEVHPWLQETFRYLHDRFGLRGPVPLFFCDAADYPRVFVPTGGRDPLPYGIPREARADGYFVLAPDYPPFAALWRDLWEASGAAERRALLGPGATIEDATLLMLDSAGGHELGHITMLRSYGLLLDRWAHWLDELLATYLARCAMLRTDPTRLAFVDAWMARTARMGDVRTLTHTTLEDFERAYTGVGMEHYSWYQGQFGTLCARIHDDLGESFVDRIAEALGGAQPTAALPPRERFAPDGAVMQRIATVWPPITEWSESLGSGGAGNSGSIREA